MEILVFSKLILLPMEHLAIKMEGLATLVLSVFGSILGFLQIPSGQPSAQEAALLLELIQFRIMDTFFLQSGRKLMCISKASSLTKGPGYQQTFVIRACEIGPDKAATMETILSLLQVTKCNMYT